MKSEDKMEMLCFRLPGHGDTTLKHLNLLRSRQHFCDITIVASDNQTFRGHKVVLAACSPFLRDQFLLNPSPRLQVSMLYSSTVMCDLLQSCYTGILQFNPEEIVNYLTAASYLQMDHIVQRCRGALKKYMQLKNTSPLKVTTEESETQPLIVSGTVHSVVSSPTSGVHGSSQYQEGSGPTLDEPCIKVHVSDEEEVTKQEDYDVFKVYISEEAHVKRDQEEERGTPSDWPQDTCYPETEGVVIAEDGNYDLNPTEEELRIEGVSVESLRTLKRRLCDNKTVRGKGRGKGQGFKRRRWSTSLEKRPYSLAQHQDLWYLATTGIGGGFGLDYSQEGLKTGNYASVALPQLDFSVGDAQEEKLSPLDGSSVTQYTLEESNCSAGEGSSGLGTVRTSEGGDESVAVVESTSNVVGPVICEHCGMTFPSAHSLAVHIRSTHMLYACPCCGKHFHHSANLTRHMAVHRGPSKTHQCPLCCKTFTQKSTLIDHMNLHSGERPHRCAYCHARFAHRPALRRHLKEQHGKTTGQNSLHEQEERERAAGRIREEEQECPVTEQVPPTKTSKTAECHESMGSQSPGGYERDCV